MDTVARGDVSDRDPLLPGEARRSDMLDDAEHWVDVYAALVEFLAEVGVDPADGGRRFQRRLAYWRRRLAELIADAAAEHGAAAAGGP